MPLADFKSILGLDDRENNLSVFCLITATYAIEQYCKRRILCRKNTDYLTFTGEYVFNLREYPVRKVLSVHAGAGVSGAPLVSPENRVDPSCYYCIPDEGIREDLPFSIVLRLPPGPAREGMGIRVRYLAGYSAGKAPPDLASACLELAAWNMSRYRGRRIGMTGNVRGKGQDGEHLEASMPENVRLLLEPYRRRTI
jgi:hypothetical protein